MAGSCLFGGCCSLGSSPSTSILTAPLGTGYEVAIHTPPLVVQRMFGAIKSSVHMSSGMAVMESYDRYNHRFTLNEKKRPYSGFMFGMHPAYNY